MHDIFAGWTDASTGDAIVLIAPFLIPIILIIVLIAFFTGSFAKSSSKNNHEQSKFYQSTAFWIMAFPVGFIVLVAFFLTIYSFSR